MKLIQRAADMTASDWGRFMSLPVGAASHWRWPLPKGETVVRPWELARFILKALECSMLGQTGGVFVCPPDGNWNRGEQDFYRVSNAILASAGVPALFEGVAHFSSDELDRAAAVVFARCFMIDECIGDGDDDTFVRPEHGRLTVYFGHHEVLTAASEVEAAVDQFALAFEDSGYGPLHDDEYERWPPLGLDETGP